MSCIKVLYFVYAIYVKLIPVFLCPFFEADDFKPATDGHPTCDEYLAHERVLPFEKVIFVSASRQRHVRRARGGKLNIIGN